jgi:hypothetical protein
VAPRPGRAGDVYAPAPVLGGTTSVFVPGATGPGVLMGVSACELAGSTASFRLHDGQFTGGATNALGALITLGANQSMSDWFGPNGIAVATGVFLERVNGVTEVVVIGQ